MANEKKRKLVGRASDFFEDQLNHLDIIAAATGISRAALIRQGCDVIINRPENKAIIKEHQK